MVAFWFYTYLFAINVITFALYADDKRRAYYSLWRWPEALLLCLAVLGGAYGAASAMVLFRHKTKHPSFYITVPVCLTIWLFFLIIMALL